MDIRKRQRNEDSDSTIKIWITKMQNQRVYFWIGMKRFLRQRLHFLTRVNSEKCGEVNERNQLFNVLQLND